MSFARAKRFPYGPSSPMSGDMSQSSSDEQKVIKDVENSNPEEKRLKKQTKTCSKTKAAECSNDLGKYSKVTKQSTFVKSASYRINFPSDGEGEESFETSSLNDSFSSCSSDDVFYDSLSSEAEKTDEGIYEHHSTRKRRTAEHDKIRQYKLVNKTLTNIEELHHKTMNNMKLETNKRTRLFFDGLNRTHLSFLDKTNTQCLKMVSKLNFGMSDGGTERRLIKENIHLKSSIRNLMRQLEKNKKEADDMNSQHKYMLDRAEEKIRDLEKTIGTLKEELNALTLTGRLQNVLHTQQK